MINLIKSEFYKLKKSKTFYILLAVCAAFVVVMAFSLQGGVSMARLHPEDLGLKNIIKMSSNFGGAWFIGQSLSNGTHELIIAIFVSIFVSSEFNYGTMKNIVSKGFNRVQVYLAKLTASAAAALVILFLYLAVGGITGTILWGFDTNGIASFRNIVILILTQSLLTVAYTGVFVFAAMSLRNNVASIGVNICVVMLVPTLLKTVTILVGGGINLSNYWISENVSKLAALNPTSFDIARGVIVSIVYTIAATIAGCVLFRKQDIK